jgi:hypothetical protein
MPNWKKVIVSGSDAVLGAVSADSLTVAGSAIGATFPFTGDAVITGSLTVDASSSTSQSLSVIGSGSVVFDVIGSVGTLLEIDDDLSGTLFTANDQNGIPSFEVSASGEVYLGRAPQSLYTTVQKGPFTGVTAIFSYPTSSFTTFFINYTAYSEDNTQVGKTFVSIIPGIAGDPTATGTAAAQNQTSGRQLGEWLRFKPSLNNGIITYYSRPDSGFEDVYFKAIIKGI